MQRIITIGFFLFISILLLDSCLNSTKHSNNLNPAYQNLSKEDKKFLDTLQHLSFLYFIHETNFKTGLVKDRSTNSSPASISAMGFALPVWAVGVEHNWILRQEAAERTLNMLKFLINSDQSAKSDATGFNGFYYHFLDFKTGKRTWNSELSTIDTAWLLAGVRFAANYYNLNNNIEKEIRRLSDALSRRVNWNWSVLKTKNEYDSTITLGWTPEHGFDKIGWIGYNEALFVYVISAGSGLQNVNSIYNNWLSNYTWKEPYKGLAHIIFPPMFGHQYSHIFIDFRMIQDKYMQKKNIDYFENSRRAVLTQWKYAIQNPENWVGYDSLTWGLTACDGPGPRYNYDNKIFNWYIARGTSGIYDVMNDDGTIAPTAAAASIVFEPVLVIKTLKNMYSKYKDKGIWGKYGFVDAFNLTVNWFDKDFLGIDQGPIVLMIENFRNDFVWKYIMKDKLIKKGLKKTGFVKRK